MDKLELIQILNETATILEIKGENPFKVRAYQHAAQVVDDTKHDLPKLAALGRLHELAGIGQALAAKISEFIETGQISFYQQLLHDFPPGLVEMTQLSGLGPKKINKLWKALGLTSVTQLERACRQGQLASLSGFGAKSQTQILTAIDAYKENLDSFLLFDVEAQADELLSTLHNEASVNQVAIAGDVRRGLELVRELQLVIDVAQPKIFAERLKTISRDSKLTIRDGMARFRWRDNLPVRAQLVDAASFPFAVFMATGSREHIATLAQLAGKRGLTLNRDGLYRRTSKLALKDEGDVYRHLKLPLIPPELRENLGEIELARKNQLPQLIEEKDLKGILHVHSTYSDGDLDLREVALLAMKAGYDYVGICDHSQTAFYAGGLKEDDLKKQWDEIDRLNDNYPAFQIFKGIESDILPDGALDYPDHTLEKFDFIIGSIHSGFSKDKERMTERLVRAVKNPYLTMLGHPTGRLLAQRTPYHVDMERVLEACAAHHCLVEINAHPYRLDLDWRHHRRARELGILLSINPDAHGEPGISALRYGVVCARKGGLEAADILNSKGLYDLAEFFKQHRKKRLAKAK